MLLKRSLPLSAAVLALAGAASSVQAQSRIRVFGLDYSVDRIDYYQGVQWPSPVFAGDTVRLFESEGVTWVGNNKLLMTADDIADIFIGNPDNYVLEVNVLTSGGRVTGLSYSRTIAAIANPTPVVPSYDPNPGGITINTGTTGLGAGGNAVMGGNDGNLYGFSLQSGNGGQLLPWPVGSNCDPVVGACSLALTGTSPTSGLQVTNTNAEDVAFVPGWNGRPNYFYVINQDLEGGDLGGIERWTTTGTLESQFATGTARLGTGGQVEVPGIFWTRPNGAVARGVSKGLAFAQDTSMLPPALRRPNGAIIVSFDRDFPALQAFDVDGTLLATEFLSTTASINPPWRLDMTSCPASGDASKPHIESVAIDPVKGRIFLVNQGAFAACNLMWVLTPCVSDHNLDGTTSIDDIFIFLNAWFAGSPRADVNDDGISIDDIFIFLNRWFAGC